MSTAPRFLTSTGELRGHERASRQLTTAGRILLVFAIVSTIFSWIAGGTTGLFAATAWTLLLLAPLLSKWHLQAVRVAPPRPIQVQAGDPFVFEPSFKNDSGWFAARHVTIACGDHPEKDQRPGGHWVALRPGESRREAVAHRLLDRGRRQRLHISLSSAYPLGLVRCRLGFTLPVDMLGLPRLGSLGDLGALPTGRPEFLFEKQLAARGDEEFYGVRDWREGESLRRVHWRLSAKRGRRIMREYRHEMEAPVHLVLVPLAQERNLAVAEKRWFEHAVSFTATLAEYFLRQRRTVRLTLAGSQPVYVRGARGRTALAKILTALAEVEREPGEPGEAFADALAARTRKDEITLGIVSESMPPAGPGAMERPDTHGPAARVWNVQDPAHERLFRRGRGRLAAHPLQAYRSAHGARA